MASFTRGTVNEERPSSIVPHTSRQLNSTTGPAGRASEHVLHAHKFDARFDANGAHARDGGFVGITHFRTLEAGGWTLESRILMRRSIMAATCRR
jgi:hypothetical protein